MMFLWFLILIPLVIYLTAGAGHAPVPHAPQSQNPVLGYDDPIGILRRRLARGEIAPSEFETMRRTLGR
jgi:uncharacterized membrane protein